jgi:hypothetical protein
MKWWLLFIFDLVAVLCAVRAGFLTHAAKHAGTPLEHSDQAWSASEAVGWTVTGCIVAFAAFLAATIPF